MTSTSAPGAPPAALRSLFGRARRRLRAVWLTATTSELGPWVAGAAVLVALVGWVRPWSWPEPAALAVLAIGLVAAVVGAVALRLPDQVVARALDRGLDTDDALVTALQFAPTDAFGPRVHARAESFAGADVSPAMPMPWRPKAWALLAALVTAVILLVVLRNPQDEVRERLAADQERIAGVADDFEERAEELDGLGTEEADALADELRALAEALRQADDVDAAVEALEGTQDELLRSVDAEDLAQRAAAQGLERTLDANPLSAGDTAAEQLEALAAAAESLSPEEQAALAERLEQLADTQDAGDPETAEALREAAEALAGGDAAAAAQALEDAGESAAAAAASAAAGAEVSDAAAAAGRAADALEAQEGQAAGEGEGQSEGQGQGEGQGEGEGEGEGEGQGQGEGEGEGQGQGQGEGQGQGQGEGQGQGQGEGQGEGQGQGEGGGSGGMEATGNNPSGTAATNPGVNGSGEMGEGIQAPPPDTPVLIPEGLDTDTASADVDVTGEGTTQTDQRGAGPTGSGTATVPLESIANDFADRATDALNGTNISGSEADTAAGYFDAITQEGSP